MTPSRSSDWRPPSNPYLPTTSSARPGWATRPASPNGSISSARLAPLIDPLPQQPYRDQAPYRPHTSYYPQPPSEPTSHAPRPQTSAKHTNETEDGSKKKKRRVALACAECAKRKQRCNRETPCQHCLARRVPELCVPYTRSGTPPPRGVKLEPTLDRKMSPRQAAERPALPTLSVRMARVEDLLNVMVNRVPGLRGTRALDAWRINHPPAISPEPEVDVDDDNDDDEPTLTLSENPLSAHSMGGDKAMTPEHEDVGRLDVDTAGRNPLPQSMIRSTHDVPRGLDYHGSPAEQLQKLFLDCGVQPQKIRDLVDDLPRYDIATKLVDWFFAKINFVRYPIDEKLFRQSFELVYHHGAIDSVTVLALPLIFIALALSMRVAPEAWAGSDPIRRTSSLKLYWNSKSAIIMASAVKAEHLQLVETHLLTGLYLVLMHERRLAEGWAAFRAGLTTGQAIGLHRDGSKLGIEPVMTEYRRRLWSYLLHADATYSCLLGRPTSVDLLCVDTLPPSNIDVDSLRADPGNKPKIEDEPTYGTYLSLRHRLGVIVAKIARNFQQLGNPATYRDVELIDDEFQDLIDNLPPTYRMLDFDRSWDKKLWYLATHRYYIQTEILHFRIILHRPWILRKRHSERHSRSRNVTEDSAVTDYKTRQAFKRDVPDFFETLLGGSFRSFNVAMIAGISLLLNPQTPHAGEMKEIMRLFMEQHPVNPSADDFSQQEATIIATLHRRFVQAQARHEVDADSAPASQNRSINEPGQKLSCPSTGVSHNVANRQTPLAPSQGHGTSQRSLQSPEEDQAQDMLNQWIIGQHQIGPGGDSTLTPFGMYPAQLRPFEQPYGQGTGSPYWPSGQSGFAPMSAPRDTEWSASYDLSNGPNANVYGAANADLVHNMIGSVAPGQANGPTQQYWELMINAIQPTDTFGSMAA